uniref:pseudouridine synthase n=1 Tax=Acetatifactor sp. TaxID=1872090 RepID=UPI00405679D3
MQSITITSNQAGQRFDKFLHKYLPNAGTSFLYKMLRKKNITLNGKKAEGKEILSVGDEVKFFFADETFEKFSGRESTPQNHFIQEYLQAYQKLKGIYVLYENDNIVILNKPVGILTQKATLQDISLNEWLIGYLLETNAITKEVLQSFHPSVCNRLDRNTSGIVLCGKSLAGSQLLSRMIKDRTLQKFYHTICVGELTKDEKLHGYLCKDTKTNKVTVCQEIPVTASDKEYSPIRTAYHPITHKSGFTWLEVELITGKTHQIRSHLSYIGHPIIGDIKYGNKKSNQRFRENNSLQNQLLHAYRVVFPKEEALKELSGKEIIAPYPKQFKRLTELLFQNDSERNK